MAATAGTRRVDRARVAVGVVFAANGVVMASWLSRVPAVRDALALRPAKLGLLLLCLAAGSVLALPASGPVVTRVGPRTAVLLGACVTVAGQLTMAAGLGLSNVPLTAAGLLLNGTGVSLWDVSMNVEAADVEQRLGRAIMPRFHAGFSIGTVGGALLGAGCAAAGIGAGRQLVVVAVAVLATVVVAVRAFLPVHPAAGGGAAPSASAGRAWRERRTLQVGLLTLGFALTEGSAGDWLAVALTDGHDASDAVGALGYGVFVTAMTLSRLAGVRALDRYGRAAVLRATAAVASVGLLLVVFGPGTRVALFGALLWGAGAALGFPVGMSAAADDPASAAVRVSVVSSIGYTAFLAGPPLIGLLAEHLGVLRALLVVLAALLLSLLNVGAVRPPTPASPLGSSAPESPRGAAAPRGTPRRPAR